MDRLIFTTVSLAAAKEAVHHDDDGDDDYYDDLGREEHRLLRELRARRLLASGLEPWCMGSAVTTPARRWPTARSRNGGLRI